MIMHSPRRIQEKLPLIFQHPGNRTNSVTVRKDCFKRPAVITNFATDSTVKTIKTTDITLGSGIGNFR
jgi:hypothetical protein